MSEDLDRLVGEAGAALAAAVADTLAKVTDRLTDELLVQREQIRLQGERLDEVERAQNRLLAAYLAHVRATSGEGDQ
jgi:hypothetical protein